MSLDEGWATEVTRIGSYGGFGGVGSYGGFGGVGSYGGFGGGHTESPLQGAIEGHFLTMCNRCLATFNYCLIKWQVEKDQLVFVAVVPGS